MEVVEDLREIYMGQWGNMTFEEIKQKYPAEYEARGRDLAGVPAPGGESFADCERRARRAFVGHPECLAGECDRDGPRGGEPGADLGL